MRLFQGAILMFGLLAPAAGFAQTQGTPLRLDIPDSSPDRLTPGASWDAPALGPGETPAPLRLEWSPKASDWGVSAAVRFVEQSRTNAADFASGGLFETEAAVVRRFGDLSVGAAAYDARPVGEDVGRAPRLGPMRWRGSAAGPVVGYDTELGGRPATLSLRVYREIGTPGDSGDTASAAFVMRF